MKIFISYFKKYSLCGTQFSFYRIIQTICYSDVYYFLDYFCYLSHRRLKYLYYYFDKIKFIFFFLDICITGSISRGVWNLLSVCFLNPVDHLQKTQLLEKLKLCLEEYVFRMDDVKYTKFNSWSIQFWVQRNKTVSEIGAILCS